MFLRVQDMSFCTINTTYSVCKHIFVDSMSHRGQRIPIGWSGFRFCHLYVSLFTQIYPPRLSALLPAQDIFLAGLEDLAYALSGLEPGAAQDDPIQALRQLLQGGDGGAGGEGRLTCRHLLR